MRRRLAASVLSLAASAGLFGCATDDTAVAGTDASADATLDGPKPDATGANDASKPDASPPPLDAARLDPEAGCLATGGTVAMASCCFQVGDFPDTCAAGACACAPAFSVPTKTCACPSGTCFGAKVPGCVVWDGGLFVP